VACAASALCVAGCGQDGSREGSESATGGDGGAGPTEPLREPPSPPDGPVADGTVITVLAVTELFIGDTDRDGTLDPEAWRELGYDLDGRLSGASDGNQCARLEGADPGVTEDGAGGIDNSFGRNLLTVIRLIDPRGSENIAGQIEAGRFSYLFRFDNLGTGPVQTDVDAALYLATARDDPPLFDGTDAWPVDFDSVIDGDVESPRIVFPTSFVTNGTWASGARTDFELIVTIGGAEMPFNVLGGVITMDLVGLDSDPTATNGVIAGVVDTEQLVSEFRRAAAQYDSSLCSGPIIEGLVATVRESADIMLDGTAGDPSETCNGISIGLGFNASAAMLGEVAPADPEPPDPCAAGAGGSTG